MSYIEEIRKEFNKIAVQEDHTLHTLGKTDVIEEYENPKQLPKKFPLFWVHDNVTNEEHLYGTNQHDSVLLDRHGNIQYRNMQNGEGTGPDGDYAFINFSDSEGEGSVLEVSMDEIRNRILGEVIEKLQDELIHEKDIERKQCEGMTKAINIVRSFLHN